MAVITYEQLALGWKPDSRRDHIFNIIAICVLAVFLISGAILSSIPVPKPQRDVRVPVPERVAKFITEKPKPKPKEIHRTIPKPPPPLPKPLVRREKPEHKKPLTKLEKKARKKAEESGLLALTSQLSDLMDTRSIDKQVAGRVHASRGGDQAATVDSNVLSANSGQGSGGAGKSIASATTGQTTRLDDNQMKLAKKLLASHGRVTTVAADKSARQEAQAERGDNLRAEEDVAYIMDKHKSVLHALYRRARRSNPGLKGKIVLELTILPSGKVAKVRIVSSELHNHTLEESLVSRIRQFDFGARPVETLTVTIPVVFLPS